MNIATYAFTAMATLTAFTATAADIQAGSAAEARFWAFSEQIALSLPGHPGDVARIVSGSARATTDRLNRTNALPGKEIGPSLYARNSVILVGAGNRTESVTFNLSGSCVSATSLRSQYPTLIVMDYARPDSPHATYTFGAQVGDAIIAHSFDAERMDCMNKVEITPAAETKARLRMD